MTRRRAIVTVAVLGWWLRRRGVGPFVGARVGLFWWYARRGGTPEPVRSGPPGEALP